MQQREHQSWEGIPERALAKFPRNHRNLDTWIEEADEAIDQAHDKAGEKTVLGVSDVRAVFGDLSGASTVTMEIFGTLALLLWQTKPNVEIRLPGCRSNAAPFGHLNEVVEFVASPPATLGFAPTKILKSDTQSADDRPSQWAIAAAKHNRSADRAEERAAKGRAEARGATYERSRRQAPDRIKGLAEVDLRADVGLALRASGVGTIDLWLIEATTIGATIGLTDTGGNGGAPSVAVLRWTKEKGGKTGRRERMKRDVAAEALRRMAGLLPTDEGASDEAISKRITRATKALEEALLSFGLVEPRKERKPDVPAESSKRKRDAMPRDRPEPIRPRFASEGT